jgi:hypothetical protein
MLQKGYEMARLPYRLCMTPDRLPLAWSLLADPVMRMFLAVLCLLAITACDEQNPVGPTVGMNERFTLAPGEVATVRDVNLNVQFVEVTGDSRCPADAICIQGGDALVHIRVLDNGATSTYELHTGDSSRATVTHNQVRIALVELAPYPFSSRTIAPSEYRATLTVTR